MALLRAFQLSERLLSSFQCGNPYARPQTVLHWHTLLLQKHAKHPLDYDSNSNLELQTCFNSLV